MPEPTCTLIDTSTAVNSKFYGDCLHSEQYPNFLPLVLIPHFGKTWSTVFGGKQISPLKLVGTMWKRST